MDCREMIMSDEYADFVDQYLYPNVTITDEDRATYCIQTISNSFFTYHVKRNDIPPLNLAEYRYTVFPKCYGLMDTLSLEQSGILAIRNQPVLNLRGSGVIIGFIDTGIDYRNNLFKHQNNTTRILGIWDQTINTGMVPDGFLAGTMYTREMINEALASADPAAIVPSVDEIGHGTRLASIAAGNVDTANDFSGAAPDCDIAVVKLKQAKPYLKEFFRIRSDAVAFQENDIMLGVKFLNELATRENKPLVVCIGLGTSYGGHVGMNNLARLLEILSGTRGRAVVTGTGNEANERHHYLGQGDRLSEYDEVELRVGEGESGFAMELWSEPSDLFSVSITSPSGEIIPRIPARIGESSVYNFVFESTHIIIDYLNVEASGGRQLIMMRFRDPTAGIWKIRVYYTAVVSGVYNIWLPIRNFMRAENYFIRSNPNITLTGPATADRIIATGAYDARNNSIYINSGRGFTADGRIKPDFASPGVEVSAGLPDNRFGTVTGTSAAAAIGAGATALLMEWGIVRGNRPYLNADEIQTYLIRGANRAPNVQYPNREFGYGTLNLMGAFEAMRIQ